MHLILSLLACGSSGEAPEQLEAIQVVPSALIGDGYEAYSETSSLLVQGEDQDWLLSVQLDGGTEDFSIHSPGHSDLSVLDGKIATVDVTAAGLHEERAIQVSDDDGLLYLANDGAWRESLGGYYSAEFASHGEVVATARDAQYDWSYTFGVFQGDGETLELLPGETGELEVDGLRFRVSLIAAYQVEPRPRAALPCGGIDDMLSYEMVRVDEVVEPETLLRPADQDIAHVGCL